MADSLWYFRNTDCPQETEEYTAEHGPGRWRHHTQTSRTTLTSSLQRPGEGERQGYLMTATNHGQVTLDFGHSHCVFNDSVHK